LYRIEITQKTRERFDLFIELYISLVFARYFLRILARPWRNVRVLPFRRMRARVVEDIASRPSRPWPCTGLRSNRDLSIRPVALGVAPLPVEVVVPSLTDGSKLFDLWDVWETICSRSSTCRAMERQREREKRKNLDEIVKWRITLCRAKT